MTTRAAVRRWLVLLLGVLTPLLLTSSPLQPTSASWVDVAVASAAASSGSWSASPGTCSVEKLPGYTGAWNDPSCTVTALKADVPGLIHKSDAGAVRLGLRGAADVRSAYGGFAARFAGLRGVLVQAMAAEGVEVLCGIVQEPVFGPLVVFGLGGVATEVLGDRCARLTPLTDVDAAELVRSIRGAPLLLGHRGRPSVDTAALEDVLLRLSRLADDHPGVAELDLNPVIARADGTVAVDARVRVVPGRRWDPYLRRLR